MNTIGVTASVQPRSTAEDRSPPTGGPDDFDRGDVRAGQSGIGVALVAT